MLRGSGSKSGVDVDIRGINGDADAAGIGIKYGRDLMLFAEAVASRDAKSLKICRENLLKAAGQKVVVEAAAVAANFQRMVRIADSTGIPIDKDSLKASKNVRKDLNLAKFASARHTAEHYADFD